MADDKISVTRRWVRKLEVHQDTDADVDIFLNKDTRPLPPSRRTYGPWEFVTLWMVTGSFNVGGWTVGSSLISLGLNVWVGLQSPERATGCKSDANQCCFWYIFSNQC